MMLNEKCQKNTATIKKEKETVEKCQLFRTIFAKATFSIEAKSKLFIESNPPFAIDQISGSPKLKPLLTLLFGADLTTSER